MCPFLIHWIVSNRSIDYDCEIDFFHRAVLIWFFVWLVSWLVGWLVGWLLVCLLACLFVCVSVCLSDCLFVCLFVFVKASSTPERSTWLCVYWLTCIVSSKSLWVYARLWFGHQVVVVIVDCSNVISVLVRVVVKRTAVSSSLERRSII